MNWLEIKVECSSKKSYSIFRSEEGNVDVIYSWYGEIVIVASHDNHPFARFTCPSLTTAAHDYTAVSEHAVETLFRLIENGGRFDQREETFFPAHLIIRESA